MSKTTTLLLVFCLILSGCGNHKSHSDQSALRPDSLSELHSHAQQLFDKARELQKGEDYPAAISAYQQLISLEPTGEDIRPVANLMKDFCNWSIVISFPGNVRTGRTISVQFIRKTSSGLYETTLVVRKSVLLIPFMKRHVWMRLWL